jgi:hypothetical protein
MKKIMIILLSVALTLGIAACDLINTSNLVTVSDLDKSKSASSQMESTPTSDPAKMSPTAEPSQVPLHMNIGDIIKIGAYKVTITEVVRTKDNDGRDAVLVTYDWTNDSKDMSSPIVSIFLSAYQNEVKLKPVHFINGIDMQKGATKVRPGIVVKGLQSCFSTVDTSALQIEINDVVGFWKPAVVDAEFPAGTRSTGA